jgi:hypothetical protein
METCLKCSGPLELHHNQVLLYQVLVLVQVFNFQTLNVIMVIFSFMIEFTFC